MIRNLKVLLGAAMVLAAFGAFSASGAQAHTPAEFHCHVEPCAATLEADGTEATAHHVFVVKNSIGETVSFTCTKLEGFATSTTKTATSLEFTNLQYTVCKAAGQAVTVRMNGCKYNFTATGTVTITGCEAGKKIEVEIVPTGCIATVKEQGPLTGISFHNIGTTATPPAASNTHETAEAKVPNIAVELDGTTAKCLIDVTKTPITSEYTTGNTTITGFNDPAGTPADKHGGVRADIWWTATVA